MLDLSPTSRAHCLNLTPEDVKATLKRDLVPGWRPLLTDAGLPWKEDPDRRSGVLYLYTGCSVGSTARGWVFGDSPRIAPASARNDGTSLRCSTSERQDKEQ